ncbi:MULTISPECIES: hypothetical protein [unclassified Bradyrhizobium]|uniref:hypothetical protein n=1 Tax=unclassified Bradyrhizobium TaxID=2631580 RepID=UPI001FF790DB|nr:MULTISPECIES: hypothetical protein [unclassified Bradyrhizobium]MCK1471182.1 hypothetical protein [Bradyrhizobium sp. CW10]UPK23386.1 hypothetical protein IVA73_37890 [Bradyrhizobium sp. 131]
MKLDHNMQAVPMESATSPQLEAVTRPSLAMSTSTSLRPIEQQAGLIDRWRAGREAGRQAGRSLADLRTEQVLAQARVGFTALKLAEAQIKSALVSSSLVAIGALTLDLGRKTAAIDARLTTSGQGEVVAHMQNRAASASDIKGLEQNGRISADEANALMSFAQADAINDINRTRDRMQKAKDVIGTLHGLALDGITRAKDSIG